MKDIFKNIENHFHIYGVDHAFLNEVQMPVFVGGDWIGDEDGDALDEIFSKSILELYRRQDNSDKWNLVDDKINFYDATSKIGLAVTDDWLILDHQGRILIIFDARNMFVFISTRDELEKIDVYERDGFGNVEYQYLRKQRDFSEESYETRRQYEHYRPFNIAK